MFVVTAVSRAGTRSGSIGAIERREKKRRAYRLAATHGAGTKLVRVAVYPAGAAAVISGAACARQS
jgi:hypothetical protein